MFGICATDPTWLNPITEKTYLLCAIYNESLFLSSRADAFCKVSLTNTIEHAKFSFDRKKGFFFQKFELNRIHVT